MSRSDRPYSGDVLDAQAIRFSHRSVVLRKIWDSEAISRADLARATGFSRSTISAIVGELLGAGLVVETRRGASRGGRRPILLELVSDSRVMVGVEIGGGHVSCALVDLRGRVLEHVSQDFDTRDRPQETIDIAATMIRRCVLEPAPIRPRLLGIGVGLPAPVAPGTSETLALVLPAWEGVDVIQQLEARFRVPVFADNDANAGMRGEARWGAAQGCEHAAFIKVATGIGAGFRLGGQLFSGHQGFAGELGHMSIDTSGPPCVCGLNGCLNVVVGTPPLLDRCRIRRSRYPDTLLDLDKLSVASLVQAALQGDSLAREVVGYAGSTLGIAIANVLNLLNLERVVLGGRITRAGDHLLGPLQASLNERALSPAISESTVVISENDQAVCLGAACLVLEAALAEQRISIFSKEDMAA
ncbi:MAG: ROK family transcriptional regulator [Myxococcota bacterium]